MLLAACGSPAKTPAALPTDASASPSPSATPDPASAVDIRNATFEVPKFPGTGDCPAGTRKFVDGKADVDPEPDPVASHLFLGTSTVADVDGVPGSEILTVITCAAYEGVSQVLALKLSPAGALSPLGFVLRSADHPSFEIDPQAPIVVRDGVVEATVMSPGSFDGGHKVLDLQVRGYKFQDGSFRQVSGPAKFAQPPADLTKTEVANSTVEVMTAKGRDFVKLVNGSGQARIGETVYSVTVLRSRFASGANPAAVVLYRLVDPAGVVTETLVGYKFLLNRTLSDNTVDGVESGVGGIARVQTFDIQSYDPVQQVLQVKVTVELTGGGTEVRIYRERSNAKWERVS
jgi:hypothetical protein